MLTIRSLPTVSLAGWLFKASEHDSGILIVAFSLIDNYSSVRFFTSEKEAHDWVDFLLLTSGVLKKDDLPQQSEE